MELQAQAARCAWNLGLELGTGGKCNVRTGRSGQRQTPACSICLQCSFHRRSLRHAGSDDRLVDSLGAALDGDHDKAKRLRSGVCVMRANRSDAGMDRSAIDTAMMRRCIRLSATAAERGEFPFASIICAGDAVIAEATNQVARDGDVTRHAELVAVSEAQKKLGRKDLSEFTLYSNVEPCAMCSFPIRETRIGRVVYAIGSPMMGGLSKWNILRDTELTEAMPEVFGPAPEVIAGLCHREAEKVWWTWNPLVWAVIRQRGCFGRAADAAKCDHLPAIPRRTGFIGRLMLLYRLYRHG